MQAGVVELHTTEMNTFRFCKRQWALQELAGLQPVRRNPNFVTGSAVHRFLEVYYAGRMDAEAGFAAYEEYAENEFDNLRKEFPNMWAEQEDELLDAISLGKVMVEGYVEYYGGSDDFNVVTVKGKPLVELDFSAPILTPSGKKTGYLFGGTIDIIKRDEVGIWLGEHKTATKITTKHLSQDDQATQYMAWAVSQWPKLRGKLRGVHYNFLRKQEPGPRVKAPLFYRERVYRNEYEMDNAMFRVYQVMKDMVRVAKDPEMLAYPSPNRDCTWRCPYRSVCMAMEDGSDVRWLIESSFIETESRNGWSPDWKFWR